MDLVFNLEEVQSVEEAKAGGFGVLDSGMYKNCTIVRGVLGKTENGNNIIDISVKTETGHEHTIYQAFCLDTKWVSGADNKYGYAKWLRFAKACKLSGLNTFQEPLLDNEGKQIMKKGTQEPVIFTSVKGLQGAVVDLGIQKVLDVYKGEETEENEIYDTFAVGSESSDKLGDRIKDRKTKGHKAFFADGGDVAVGTDPSAPAPAIEGL